MRNGDIERGLVNKYKLTDTQKILIWRMLDRTGDENIQDVCVHWYGNNKIRINKKLKSPPYYITYRKDNKTSYSLPITYIRYNGDWEIEIRHKVNKNTLFSLVKKGIMTKNSEYEYVFSVEFKRWLSSLEEVPKSYDFSKLK